jgi:hypothetical protein
MLRVRDIVKFGRVNFKITEINCDRMDKEFTGTCHSTNLSELMFSKQAKGKADVKPHVAVNKPIPSPQATIANEGRNIILGNEDGNGRATEVNLETMHNRPSLANI